MWIVPIEYYLIVQVCGVFDNETDRNVIFVGVYNSLSFHSENRKNNVLVLGEVPIFKRKS